MTEQKKTNRFIAECDARNALIDFARSESSIIPSGLIVAVQNYFRASFCAHPDKDIQQGHCEIAARELLVCSLSELTRERISKAENAVLTIARIHGI